MPESRPIACDRWRRPEVLLLVTAGAVPLSYATWQALLSNFAIERAAFTVAETGMLQSLREVPGFLAFAAYALVENAFVAAGVYVVDHLFFALAIAIETNFQKIADPADIASTAGVGFTVNHVAAVILPTALGVLWLVSPAAVFLLGTAMAGVSLLLSLCVPAHPQRGCETTLARCRPLLRSEP